MMNEKTTKWNRRLQHNVKVGSKIRPDFSINKNINWKIPSFL